MQSDAAGCAHMLNNSKASLQAVQSIMQIDISSTFMNGSLSTVRETRVDGLHPHQRQSHRVRFHLHVLTRLKTASNAKMVRIDTALVAYEPVLKATQDIKDVPLAEELLFWDKDSPVRPPSFDEPDIVAALELDPSCELQPYLGTSSSMKLDEKRAASLVTGLTQKFSLIQGPPGKFILLDSSPLYH